MSKVLIVDDKQMMRDSVSATLVRAGYQAVVAPDGQVALEMVAKHRPDTVVTDLKMPGMTGIELLERIGKIDPDLPVILMTAYATVDTAVDAMKKGAFDYIQKPFDGDDLAAAVKRAVKHFKLQQESTAHRQDNQSQQKQRKLIGESATIKHLFQQIEQIAASDGTVLICGESGTGKEIVAHILQRMSGRREEAMLCVNCAALSTNLLESELFGHEKGAFTGADQLRKGRFELAEGGTLLLDEISEITPKVQAKLLRVLQERQFERVGASVTMDVNVRVIATTNRKLEREVVDGSFRQDLYYRLNVLPLYIPPLRERAEDIPLFVDHFLLQQSMRDGSELKQFDDQAMALLRRYPWPGNVRELENICERAGVLAIGPVIDAALIKPWLNVAPVLKQEQTPAQIEVADDQTLEDVEREIIIRTLGKFDGHRQRTAQALGIGVRTLGLKLKKWKELELVAQSL